MELAVRNVIPNLIMADKLDLNLPADKVAPLLLGRYLCRRFGSGQVAKYLITEVEAYIGEEDKACHAHHGRTERNKIMYGPAGHWYVYLVYGLHYMLNLVTSPIGQPEAVLFRSLKGINGPGRITKRLKINKSFNGQPADRSTGLWLEAGETVSATRIARLPRIGVNYAGDWKDKLLRFKLD